MQQGDHDTALRYGRGEATTRPSGPATRPRGLKTRPGRRCDTARLCAGDNVRDSEQHGLRHGRCALRHDQGEATIRPGARPQHGRGPGHYTAGPGHDTARHGRPSTQRARSLGHGCAYCALDPVLTENTVLSHCLDYFS